MCPVFPPSEKYQNCNRSGPDICHNVLRYNLPAEASRNENRGRVQGGFGSPTSSADRREPEAIGNGRRAHSTQPQAPQGTCGKGPLFQVDLTKPNHLEMNTRRSSEEAKVASILTGSSASRQSQGPGLSSWVDRAHPAVKVPYVHCMKRSPTKKSSGLLC